MALSRSPFDFAKRGLAIHHARTGLVAELLHHVCRDCHVVSNGRVRRAARATVRRVSTRYKKRPAREMLAAGAGERRGDGLRRGCWRRRRHRGRGHFGALGASDGRRSHDAGRLVGGLLFGLRGGRVCTPRFAFRLTVEHDIGHAGYEELDRSQGIVVAGNHEVDFIRDRSSCRRCR